MRGLFRRALLDTDILLNSDLRPASVPAAAMSDGDQDLSGGDESDDGDLTDWTTDYPDTIDGKQCKPLQVQTLMRRTT